VVPLDQALGEFDAWITGRKRFHGGARLSLPVVEEADGRLKFNPLVNWTKADLDAYVAEHDLPAHPLVANGFPSVGCWPCTKPAEDGEDVRAGRWAGSQKTECGIHVARTPGAVANPGGDI
jgi:phosphoadenosine phosphosulfate reductase